MTSKGAAPEVRPGEITDIHIHIQPWDQLQPAVRERMRHGRRDYDEILAMIRDPARFLDYLDAAGVMRAGIINYPSPDIMGFSDEASVFCAEYCNTLRERLIAFGGVHPRFTKDAAGDVRRLADLGIRGIKLHPPHMVFRPAAYRDGGMKSLEAIYATCQELGLPVMFHTGTSIFPGARSRLGEPIEIDDVAIDFPEMKIILAHGGRPLWPEQAIFLIRRFPNVYMDISGIPPGRLLHYFPRLERFADKVLFGSDWPAPGVPSLAEIVRGVTDLPLSPESLRLILAGNARRLFP
ncbi:MAG TPA: amidohydrolase family protein [Candidatus Saccharimonadales bacterium]|nr:amidohydrolase family protein [Candidatus Saccharimonadales bacterium]